MIYSKKGQKKGCSKEQPFTLVYIYYFTKVATQFAIDEVVIFSSV